MPTFSRLELENFKLYRSRTAIEWKQVSSIIGQNGTGKSTIIDAVEYVFCFPRYTKKSVAFLRKVLYNKNSDDNEHSSSWVSAVVNIGDEAREFKRSVDYNESAHKYWVNNREVDLNGYTKFLMDVNINPRANNFLVQQNSIESLALKNAKHRSEFFEVLSNSIIYKPEYNRLISEMKSMQSEVNTLQSLLEFHKREKKNLIQKNNEIKMYDELSQQLEQVEFDYYYTKLYEIKTLIDCLLEQEEVKQHHISVTERLINGFTEKIDKFKNEIAKKEREITKIEKDLEKKQPEILKYKTEGMELTEKITHCENEIKKVENNLKKAEDVKSAHKKIQEDLEKQLKEIEEKKNELNKSLSQSCSLELDDIQYEEYLRLKADAQKQFTQENQGSYSTLERERNGIEDKINEYENKKEALSKQIERERFLLDQIITQSDNIGKKIDDTTSNIDNEEKKCIELDKEINQLQIQVEDINDKIEDLNKELSDLDMEQQESSYRSRLSSIINDLTVQFHPRVLGQLSQLCSVTDRRYEIAITKILGNKMDGIVVDTTNTAKECIEYLKVQYRDDSHSAIATFFPLDNFQDKPVSNKVPSKITSASYTKLATEVMSTRKIDIILKSFLGDIVICDTDDQAMTLSKNYRINIVSLDGTYFKKDGSFTGGYSDIRRKAKQWNEKEYKDKETEKQEKNNTLRSLQLQIRDKKTCLKDSQVKLESSRRRNEEYLEPELNKCKEKLKKKEDDLQKLKNDLETFESVSKIDKQKELLEDINRKLSEYKLREHEIEDKVFSAFCRKFQLENIRKYEESDVRKHEERLKERMKYDNHLNKINNQLKYEKSRNTEATVEQLKGKLSTLKKEYKKLLDAKKKWEKSKDENNKPLKNEAEIKSIRCEIDKLKKDLVFEERKVETAKKDLKESTRTVAVLSSKIKQQQRMGIHQLLTKCKVKGIDIPLKEGTIKRVDVRSRIHDTESESNGQQTESDSAIQEKDVEIDFTQLDEFIQNLEASELNNHIKSLENQRKELKGKIESFIPSNRNIKRELESLETKIKGAKNDLKTKQSQFKTIKEDFEKVKNKRRELFTDFSSSVEKEVDGIFKSLYGKNSAQAAIIMLNPDEPYLGGIDLSFMIPEKKFAMMELLSGGEKTMCAMALFLAIYSAKPAPCIIFDEIDAALDNANLQNIVSLFLKWKQTTQIISISHHERLFRCADVAIGINISARRNSSYAIHLDLTRYLQPVDLFPNNHPMLEDGHGTPTASPRERSTSSREKRSTSFAPPRLPSLGRRSSIAAPISTSTPNIIIKSVEAVTGKIIIKKRKSIG